MAYAQQPRYGPPANQYNASRSPPMGASQDPYAQGGYGYGPPAQQQAYGPNDSYGNGYSENRQGQQRPRPSPRQAQQQFQPRQQDMGSGGQGNWQGGGYDNYGDGRAVNGGWSQQPQDPYNQPQGYGHDRRHMQGGYGAQGSNQGHQRTAYGQQGGGNGYQEQYQGPQGNYQKPPRPRPAAPQRSFSAGPGPDVNQPNMRVDQYQGQPQMQIQQGKPRPAQHLGQAPPKKKEKERILQRPESPETLAWDNPFPSFPGVEEKKQAAKADSSRPQTAASNRRGHEATRSLDREPEFSSGQQYAQGQPNQHLGQQYQTSQPVKENKAPQAPLLQQRPADRGFQAHHADGYPDPRMGPMPPPQPRFANQEQRSNTLPNEVSENMVQGHVPMKPQGGAQRAVNPQRQGHPQQMPNAYPKHQNLPQQKHQRSNSYDAGSGYSQVAPQGPSNGPAPNDYHGQYSENAPRPSTASQQSKTPQQGLPRSTTPGNSQGYKQTLAQSQPTLHHAPTMPQGSSAAVMDAHNEETEPARFKPYRSPTDLSLATTEDEEDMPNFDAAPTSPTHDKALHIESQKQNNSAAHSGNARGRQMERTPTEDFAGQAHRSRSQPNLKSPTSPNDLTGFDFGIGKGQPQMPAMDPKYAQQRPSQQYQKSPPNPQYQGEWQQPSRGPFSPPPPERSYTDGFSPGPGPMGPGPRPRNGPPGPQPHAGGNGMQQWPGSGAGARSSPGPDAMGRPPPRNGQPPLNTSRAISDGSRRQGGSQMSSPNSANVASPTSSKPMNPDALPHHPAPVRSGHMQQTQSPPMNQQNPSRPPPVRQYNGSSPGAQASIAPPPAPPATAPVTNEELQRLRGAVQSRPNDQATQVVLAKKLMEAATTLADEGGRADPKTKAKNRERYIMEAYKMIKKLVGIGNVEAMFLLADCYGSGQLGLQKDPKEAFQLYQSAAKLNHPASAYRVAVCCEIGQDEGGGTRRDPVKAMQWYQRAATLGDVPAMYKLGVILLKGLLGQSRNAREAVNWLQKAAERADVDNPHALHELGLLYQNSLPNDGIPRDENAARQFFSQAADLGYKASQFKLGQAYEQGSMGFQQNPKLSIMWYSKAAMQEEHQSELGLSGWYLTGAEGVLQQNDTEAYLWARKAAQAGLAKAEYAMGYFTEVGIGAPADLEAAKRWYWKAASQNFPKARERLEDLRKGGTRIQKTRVSRSTINKSEGDCKMM